MKKITALLAAAIMALTISMPVMAEPSDESLDTASAVTSAESESPAEDEVSETESTDDENEISETESTDTEEEISDSAETEESIVSENSAEKPKKVYYTDYPIPEAEMYISFPNDMYVLTRDIDINSPALQACKLTRIELIKSFEETGNYIRAIADDFTYEVTVNILKDDNTKTIGDISALTDSEIQTIADNHLSQPIYTGCSRTKYNNIMYLSFPFEYAEGKTKIAGVQKYTIAKGARILITFQSYAGEIDKEFDSFIMSVMERVLYDGVSPEPETSVSDDKKSSAITNLDVRYVYLMITSLVALIFLMLIIITAMKYKKSRKKVLPEPVAVAEEKTETAEIKKEEPEKTETKPVEVPEKEEEKPAVEVPEKAEETPAEKPETEPEKEPETEKKPETVKEEVKQVEEEPETPVENVSEEPEADEELPVIENQLELVEIAFRIIPALGKEEEDTNDIWNFIYKKYDDIEFFASHGNRNYGNANAFYQINAASDITPPENVDEKIRTETLETVVGDNEPEKLKVEEQPAEDHTDLNELIDGSSEIQPKEKPAVAEEEEEEPQEESNEKISAMRTSEMQFGKPAKRPENEIYKADEKPIKEQNIKLEIAKKEDGSIKIGANNGEKSLDVEIEDTSK